MSIILLDRLRNLGILPDRVLLEFREGDEEVDAFVDVDGSLLLLELKDNEFSMGHAYPLPGRIAMYHPDHVLIVTSERVANEVRDYFGRIKPETKLTYAEGLDALPAHLEDALDSARAKKAKVLLERYTPRTIGVNIPALVGVKLGIKIPQDAETSWLTGPPYRYRI